MSVIRNGENKIKIMRVVISHIIAGFDVKLCEAPAPHNERTTCDWPLWSKPNGLATAAAFKNNEVVLARIPQK